MNSEENNPNRFLPDDEPNFIQMPYPVHVQSLWTEQEAPSRNYFRPIVAIIMVLLIILSVSYRTLQSIFLDRDNAVVTVNANFDVVLTGISTTTDNCQAAPHVTLGGTFSPSRRLCICGSLYTDESSVNYVFRLRTVQGNLVAQTERSNQTESSFCHRWELSNTLEEGRYVLELAVNRTSPAIETIWITIAIQPF